MVGRGGVEEPVHAWKLEAREPGDPIGFHFVWWRIHPKVERSENATGGTVNTGRILQRATGSISPVETCSAHNPCSLILSKTCLYRMIDASRTMLRIAREMSDYRYGQLDEHPSRRSRRRDEQA